MRSPETLPYGQGQNSKFAGVPRTEQINLEINGLKSTNEQLQSLLKEIETKTDQKKLIEDKIKMINDYKRKPDILAKIREQLIEKQGMFFATMIEGVKSDKLNSGESIQSKFIVITIKLIDEILANTK